MTPTQPSSQTPTNRQRSQTAMLSVVVQDRPGVLTRVAGLFSRRGYNITELTVRPTATAGFSHMRIVVDDSAPLEQVERQLGKLIDVLSVEHVRSAADHLDITEVDDVTELDGLTEIDLSEWRARPVPTPA